MRAEEGMGCRTIMTPTHRYCSPPRHPEKDPNPDWPLYVFVHVTHDGVKTHTPPAAGKIPAREEPFPLIPLARLVHSNLAIGCFSVAPGETM